MSKNKKQYKTLKIFGIEFTSEWTSIFADVSLFAFFCSKTFLGQYAIIERVSFVLFILAVLLHVVRFREKLKINKFFVWYGLFAIFAGLSYFWALSPDFVMKALPSVGALAVFVLALVLYVKTQAGLEKVLMLYLLANFIAAARILILFPFYEGTAAARVGAITGVFFNTIAQTIAFSIVIAAYFAIKRRDWKYIIPIVVMMATTVMAESRKAVLIPIIGIFLMLILKKKTKKERKIYLIIFLVFVLGTALVVLLNEGFRNEMWDLLSSVFLGKETGDWSIYLRNFFHDTALDLWRQHPVSGAGLNNFAYYVQNNTWYSEARYAHENYAELLSGVGVIGVILYYWMYVYIIVKLVRRAWKGEPADRAFALALILTLVIFERGIVTYSGVMYNVIVFAAYSIADNKRKELADAQ